MEQQQLDKFKAWLDGYTAGFYGDDAFVNANIRLKDEHSRRVCEEMLYLTRQLGLSDEQKLTAEAIALLHDIGRFEQFAKYRTYNDARSIDHALLGLEVLQKEQVLDGVDEEEKQIIEKAIEYHGLRRLPGDLEGEALLFSQLIRDADKLDIFYVVTEYYAQYADDPQGFMLELEFPDRPEYSADVIEKLLRKERIDYKSLKTLNDMKLLQLGWVYDVSFSATLRRIKKRMFLEKLIGFLPQSEDIERVRKTIFDYVDSAIEQNGRGLL
jgi:putative nucleotidyltransferase with HDIG domain